MRFYFIFWRNCCLRLLLVKFTCLVVSVAGWKVLRTSQYLLKKWYINWPVRETTVSQPCLKHHRRVWGSCRGIVWPKWKTGRLSPFLRYEKEHTNKETPFHLYYFFSPQPDIATCWQKSNQVGSTAHDWDRSLFVSLLRVVKMNFVWTLVISM